MEQLNRIKLKFINSIHHWIVGVAFATPFFSCSQINLISNGSFEILNYVPQTHDDFNSVNNWLNLNGTSQDIFIRNASQPNSGFFNNSVGSQDTPWGNAYSGIINTKRVFTMTQPYYGPYFWNSATNSSSDSYDVMGAELTQSLILGKIYKIELYSSVGDKTINLQNQSWISSNCLDVYTLEFPTIDAQNPNLYGERVLQNSSLLTDTTNWIKISDCFQAKGNERYLAIGCLRDTNEIIFQESISWGNSIEVISYIYLDNLSLSECDTCCLGEFPYSDHVNVSNNPSSSNNPTTFTIVLNANTSATLDMYDSAGRLVARNEFHDLLSNYQVDAQLAMGVYHYVLRTSNGVTDVGKVLVAL